MTSTPTTRDTLGNLVIVLPGAAKVLHRHRLDFCADGATTLERACEERGLAPERVLEELSSASLGEPGAVRWDERSIDELIEHILVRYHAPLRAELPRLVALAHKVEQAHAGAPECPRGLSEFLAEVREELDGHLDKEERILFPLILAGRGQNAHMPVKMMIAEHEDHLRHLRRLRELTRDLTPMQAAGPSLRELYRSLEQLELELFEHIHIENHILFPRALAG